MLGRRTLRDLACVSILSTILVGEELVSPLAFAIFDDVCSQSMIGLPSFPVAIPRSSLVVPGPVLAFLRASLEMGLAAYGHC